MPINTTQELDAAIKAKFQTTQDSLKKGERRADLKVLAYAFLLIIAYIVSKTRGTASEFLQGTLVFLAIGVMFRWRQVAFQQSKFQVLKNFDCALELIQNFDTTHPNVLSTTQSCARYLAVDTMCDRYIEETDLDNFPKTVKQIKQHAAECLLQARFHPLLDGPINSNVNNPALNWGELYDQTLVKIEAQLNQPIQDEKTAFSL